MNYSIILFPSRSKYALCVWTNPVKKARAMQSILDKFGADSLNDAHEMIVDKETARKTQSLCMWEIVEKVLRESNEEACIFYPDLTSSLDLKQKISKEL